MSFGTRLSAANWGRLVLIGALATGVLSATAGRGTMAYFTTQVTSTANKFTAGNLHFTIDDSNQTGQTSVATSLTLSNMKPGDVVYAPVRVTNTGSIDAKWGIKYTTTTTGGTGNLATALKLGIIGKGSGTADETAADCSAAQWGDATKWPERVLETPEGMTNAGRTIVNYTWTTQPTTDGAYTNAEAGASHFLPLHPSVDDAGAATGDGLAIDVLCITVQFPDAGAPGSLSTGDNAWNGSAPTSYDTIVVFTFDGMQRVLTTETDSHL
jgi:predicted ribosomally synthesized peptide with SipW-like signal peptide